MTPDLASVVVRTLAFVCLFQAAGAAFFVLLFASAAPRSDRRIRRLGIWSAASAMALLLVHQGLDAARMAGDYSGLADLHMQSLAWQGSSGNAALFEILGLGVIVVGLTRRALDGAAIASTGALIASCAAVLTGHTSVHSQRALLGMLLALHLVLVAFWFGALLPLMVCCQRESRPAAVAVLQGFSSVAGALVPCIAVAGLSMALILMPTGAAWGGRYGSLVLVKIAAFAALMLLAAWNRWRAVPAIAASDAPRDRPGAVQALRRAIAGEYVLMLGVLATTAVLTTFYSPEGQ